MISSIKRSYLAGFFDGDGNIIVNITTSSKTHRKSYYVAVQVVNTKREILELFKESYKGIIYDFKNKSYLLKHPKYNMSWIWRLTSRQAICFLKEIFPFMVLKKNQALAAFELDELIQKTKKIGKRDSKGRYVGGRITAEGYKKRQAIKDKISNLNKGRKVL